MGMNHLDMSFVKRKVRGLRKRINGTSGTINNWPKKQRMRGVMALYKRKLGDEAEFDIKHPVLFNEKIVSYKVLYERDGLENIVDKFLFKKYIKNKLGEGYTIPMLGAWDKIDNLEKDWEKLPERFVLKSTVQSDGKFIKVIKNKTDVDFSELKKELTEWLKPSRTLINSYCYAYYHATPRILAEEYMENIDNQLFDYKIFCFDGKPYCFYVATNHFSDENYPITFYDLDWNMMDVHYGNHGHQEVEKPVHLDEMIEIAKKLSEGFPFIRVDFFDLPDKLYCAEMTLYPGGGQTFYYPREFNLKMGEMFHFPA